MAFVIIKSASRAAMFSAVIAGTILVSYYGFRKWKHFKYALLCLLPLLFFIILSKSTDSIIGRLLIWKISILSFLDRPFVGIGYGFFSVEYLNFKLNILQKEEQMPKSYWLEPICNHSTSFLSSLLKTEYWVLF